MLDFLSSPVLVAAIVVAVLLVIIIGLLSMWKRVPQDKALVVTGLRRRVITGGGGLVIPGLERTDSISLENMQIDVIVRGLTSKGVEIQVGALTILKIKNEEEKILAAMEQFNTGKLEGTVKNIKETSREVLEGKLREILSRMTVEEIYQDREKFASSVQDVAAKELEDMGLEIKAFTIKEISDDQDYLKSLGKKQVAEVKKEAAIAESTSRKEQELIIAENDKQTAIKVAELKRDTAIQLAKTEQEEKQARIAAEVEIANADKEKEIKILNNNREVQTQKASSDAAYEIENNRVQQEVIETQMAAKLAQEAKNVDLTNAQMKVRLTEKEQETVIATQEAKRIQEELAATMQKTAEAEAAKIKVTADAELYKKEKDAEAQKIQSIKKAEADAEQKRLAATAESEAKKIQADADAIAIERRGAAEASATEATGLAKAKAVEAEGLAEARVIREKAFAEAEAMQKKADAYKQYGEAAMTEMIVKVLPEITQGIAAAIAEPMSKIGNITILDSGSGEGSKGASKVAGYASSLLTQVPEVVKATTGIDLIQILNKTANSFMKPISEDSNPNINVDEANSKSQLNENISNIVSAFKEGNISLPNIISEFVDAAGGDEKSHISETKEENESVNKADE